MDLMDALEKANAEASNDKPSPHRSQRRRHGRRALAWPWGQPGSYVIPPGETARRDRSGTLSLLVITGRPEALISMAATRKHHVDTAGQGTPTTSPPRSRVPRLPPASTPASSRYSSSARRPASPIEFELVAVADLNRLFDDLAPRDAEYAFGAKVGRARGSVATARSRIHEMDDDF